MGFVEQLSATISSVSKDVGERAKEVSGIARLRFDIRTKQDFLREQYVIVGKAYYEAHKDEEVPEKENFMKIKEALDEIKNMELQILELKKIRRCPECGAEASDTAVYCSRCGEKLSPVTHEKEDPMSDIFEEEDASEEDSGKYAADEAAKEGEAENMEEQPAEEAEMEEQPEEKSEYL